MSRASVDLPTSSADSLALPRRTHCLSLALGIALSLCVSGYQFGRGNHAVYLLDAMRQINPALLSRDWFTAHTFQYHAVFTYLTSALTRAGLERPGFLAIYLVIVFFWQLGWQRVVFALGGRWPVYLLSVLLYYLSAAGISVGVYQFLQDACFLPSNVSNVALLWGIYFWATNRKAAAGAAMGVAGFFHINYAVAAVGAWGALSLWEIISSWRSASLAGTARAVLFLRSAIIGTILVLALSAPNLAMAIVEKLHNSGSMPLDEFVNVYVRFRHTHHLDPLHYPIALWIAYLWPMPLAAWTYFASQRRMNSGGTLMASATQAPRLAGEPARRGGAETIAVQNAPRARQQVARFCILLAVAQLISVLFAGVWWTSGLLVQLSIHRFSIYLKLFTCIGAAWILWERVPRKLLGVTLAMMPLALAGGISICLANASHRMGALGMAIGAAQAHLAALWLLIGLVSVVVAMLALVDRAKAAAPASDRALPRVATGALVALLAVILIVMGLRDALGIGMAPPPDDPDYLRVCDWARENSPIDALFLTPPGESAFRLAAQRGIVINFKHVPQLGGEIPVWRDRLKDVLGVSDLTALPRGYDDVMREMDRLYSARPIAELADVAGRYGARFIVVREAFSDEKIRAANVARAGQFGAYFVYDRDGAGPQPTTRTRDELIK